MAKNRAAGIDLGTTYSATAWVDETGKSALIPNSEGDLLTPSVVLFEDQSIIVGKEAKKVAVMNADRVAVCVKRDMGKPVYTKPIRGQYLPPEVIQSYILKKLRTDITKSIGPDFQAVITVPAFFDEPRRRATYDAGQMAGLKVLDIVNEPTAAALAFGQDLGYLTKFGAPKERINVVVYDLGGGTFDVTLIDMKAGDLRTICTDGDVQLGGHDWDMRLVDYMAEEFIKQHNEDPRKTAIGLQRLLFDAEELKHTLSARSVATARVQYNGKTCEVKITREQFEERTADLVERTRYTTRNLLTTAGLAWKDIGRILLTGGSTRMPMIIKMLTELSGLKPDHTVNPDEAVARGAAIYAGYLLAAKGEGGHKPTFDVSNVNAHSLGIEGTDSQTLRKRNTILIPRNSKLPAKKTEPCMLAQMGQNTVVVQVLEGESLEPEHCTPIGRTVIRDLPPNLPKGWPVDVTYEYGINGRLTVHALVKGTDREVRLNLERDESLSEDRINRWKNTVAKGGGMDAFEMAIQSEMEELKKHAALSGVGKFKSAAGVPGGGGAAGLAGPQMAVQPAQPSGIGASGSGSGSNVGIGRQQPGAPGMGMAPGSSIGVGGMPVQPGSGMGSSIGVGGPPGSGVARGVPTGTPVGVPVGMAGMPTTISAATPSGIAMRAGVPVGTAVAPGMAAPMMAPVGQPVGMSGIGQRAGVPVGAAVASPGAMLAAGATAVAGSPAAAPAGAPAAQAKPKKKSKEASPVGVLMQVFISVVGLVLVYYAMVAMVPSANFLRLNLPGLPPVIEDEAAGAPTPAPAPAAGAAPDAAGGGS
jgi:molecular chaperone DnaK